MVASDQHCGNVLCMLCSHTLQQPLSKHGEIKWSAPWTNIKFTWYLVCGNRVKDAVGGKAEVSGTLLSGHKCVLMDRPQNEGEWQCPAMPSLDRGWPLTHWTPVFDEIVLNMVAHNSHCSICGITWQLGVDHCTLHLPYSLQWPTKVGYALSPSRHTRMPKEKFQVSVCHRLK
jgi:ribosomal protein S27E